MKISKYLLLLPIAGSLALTACGDDDGPDDDGAGEEELITGVTMALTGTDGEAPVVFTLDDPDGEGGNDAVTMGGTLEANSTYTFTTSFVGDPAEPGELMEEIREEDEEHQVFYVARGVDIDVAYSSADADADGNPLGLSGELTTGDAGSGTLVVTLRHEPNKDASGVADGDITNAGGETDVEARFPVALQ